MNRRIDLLQEAGIQDVFRHIGTDPDRTAAVAAEIQNRDTSVNTNTIKLEVNGVIVSPTIGGTAGGATVTWAMTPLPAIAPRQSELPGSEKRSGRRRTGQALLRPPAL